MGDREKASARLREIHVRKRAELVSALWDVSNACNETAALPDADLLTYAPSILFRERCENAIGIAEQIEALGIPGAAECRAALETVLQVRDMPALAVGWAKKHGEARGRRGSKEKIAELRRHLSAAVSKIAKIRIGLELFREGLPQPKADPAAISRSKGPSGNGKRYTDGQMRDAIEQARKRAQGDADEGTVAKVLGCPRKTVSRRLQKSPELFNLLHEGAGRSIRKTETSRQTKRESVE